MKKLIIITGVSGTGKSSLSQSLNNRIDNSTLLSFDKVLENIHDIMGFKDKTQKKSLRKLSTIIYKKLIEEACDRGDEVIIIEYPFRKKWLNFFLKLINKYNYEVYTINMFAKNFDIIWNRLLKREMSKQERHPSHYLDFYNPKKKDTYKPYFEYNYNILKGKYDKLVSNSINLGTTINVKDIEELDIEKLINTIMKK